MPIVNCEKCKKEFYAKPSWLEKGWGKYCSPKCHHEGLKKGKFVVCSICHKKIWRKPRQLKHSKSGKYFCNKSCQTLWRNTIVFVGENHPNWKTGERNYGQILDRNKREQVCVLCKNKDKRVLAVHHLDGNKKNVELKNLIWLCWNCHFLVHHDKDTKKRLMAVVV